MICQDPATEAICLNTAEVPRIKHVGSAEEEEEAHHFVIADFQAAELLSIERVWVAVTKDGECRVAASQLLLRKGAVGLELWDDYLGAWRLAAV